MFIFHYVSGSGVGSGVAGGVGVAPGPEGGFFGDGVGGFGVVLGSGEGPAISSKS